MEPLALLAETGRSTSVIVLIFQQVGPQLVPRHILRHNTPLRSMQTAARLPHLSRPQLPHLVARCPTAFRDLLVSVIISKGGQHLNPGALSTMLRMEQRK